MGDENRKIALKVTTKQPFKKIMKNYKVYSTTIIICLFNPVIITNTSSFYIPDQGLIEVHSSKWLPDREESFTKSIHSCSESICFKNVRLSVRPSFTVMCVATIILAAKKRMSPLNLAKAMEVPRNQVGTENG